MKHLLPERYAILLALGSMGLGGGCSRGSVAGNGASATLRNQERARLARDVTQIANDAAAAAASNQPERAKQLYLSALSKQPPNALVRHDYARLLVKTGDARGALGQYREIMHPRGGISSFQSDPITLMEDASLCERFGDSAEAKSAYAAAVASDWYRLGSRFPTINQHPADSRSLKANALLALSVEYAQTARGASALTAAKAAVALIPTDATAHLYLGEAYSTVNKWPEARQEFDLALRYNRQSDRKISEYVSAEFNRHGEGKPIVTGGTIKLIFPKAAPPTAKR